MKSPGASISLLYWGWVFPLTMAACALPDSHLPNGFSGSYYRHLQQGLGITQIAPTPLSEQVSPSLPATPPAEAPYPTPRTIAPPPLPAIP